VSDPEDGSDGPGREDGEGSSLRGVAMTAAQYALALAALAWVLSGVDLGRTVDLLARVDLPTVAGLLGVSVVGLVARFYTWKVTMDPLRRVSLRAAGSTDLVVNFVNQLLPSRLSGRVAAPFVVRARTGMDYADAAAVSGVHTGMYALLYGGTALVGLLVALGRLSPGLVALLAASTGLYLVAGAVVVLAGTNLTLLDRLVDRVAALLRRVPVVGDSLADRRDGVLEFTEASTVASRRLYSDPGVWVRYAAGWSVALVVAPGVRVWLLLSALGPGFEPALLLPLYLVAAYSVTLVPLTPGGIGVTEATATAVFVALGVPGEAIVPVILADRVLGVYLPALAGWYPSVRLDRSALAPE
jgi:uncharacterized protein (TIRG00374 family)